MECVRMHVAVTSKQQMIGISLFGHSETIPTLMDELIDCSTLKPMS